MKDYLINGFQIGDFLNQNKIPYFMSISSRSHRIEFIHDFIFSDSRFSIMANENFAGNIIINLANLPDFLRNPILKKRMIEFFSLSEPEKTEVINNALEAGPTIPFPNFAKLFKTWLKILTTLPEEQREGLFSAYIIQVAQSPQKLITFHMDGILEIFLTLEKDEMEILASTIKKIVNNLDEESKRRMMIVIPENAKMHLNF